MPHILIVDDDESIRALLQKGLEQLGGPSRLMMAEDLGAAVTFKKPFTIREVVSTVQKLTGSEKVKN